MGTGRRLRSGRVAHQPLGFDSLALRGHSTKPNVLDKAAGRVILKMLRRQRYQYQFESPG